MSVGEPIGNKDRTTSHRYREAMAVLKQVSFVWQTSQPTKDPDLNGVLNAAVDVFERLNKEEPVE